MDDPEATAPTSAVITLSVGTYRNVTTTSLLTVKVTFNGWYVTVSGSGSGSVSVRFRFPPLLVCFDDRCSLSPFSSSSVSDLYAFSLGTCASSPCSSSPPPVVSLTSSRKAASRSIASASAADPTTATEMESFSNDSESAAAHSVANKTYMHTGRFFAMSRRRSTLMVSLSMVSSFRASGIRAVCTFCKCPRSESRNSRFARTDFFNNINRVSSSCFFATKALRPVSSCDRRISSKACLSSLSRSTEEEGSTAFFSFMKVLTSHKPTSASGYSD
mmetsp:Transcript_11519/g.38078  ORF Transcript_11519/g.38078 Transcript_11519/m.38078 type:complete len:274 (+) Transcript_11519:1020-1841(+)